MLRVDIFDSFDAPELATAWSRLSSATVFTTWGYQRAWWECQTRPEARLMLMLLRRGGEPVAIAPLFSEAGMVYFVGSGGSDYLGVVGECSVPVLGAALRAARDRVAGWAGAVFHQAPDSSPLPEAIRGATEALGLQVFEEGAIPAPALDIAAEAAAAAEAAQKRSLLAAEKHFTKSGELRAVRVTDPTEVAANLPAFFQQHIDRWASTDAPSLFLDEAQRRFYHRLVELGGPVGWLRFTRVDWNGQPIAFHFGFCHGGRYVYYKPTFDVALAKYSPGQVLLRHVLLEAIAEGAAVFDFGIGDEAYKMRFATRIDTVRQWGVYPR